MSRRLKKGDTIPNFVFDSYSQREMNFYKVLGSSASFMVFLRDFSCIFTINFIKKFIEDYYILKHQEINLVIVVQDSPERVASLLQSKELPFTIICDSESALYSAFAIPKAKNKFSLLSLNALPLILKAKKNKINYSRSLDNNLQLPATFFIDARHCILNAYYGESITDIPSLKPAS